MLERERYQRALCEEECEEKSRDLKVIDGEEPADGDEPPEDDSPGRASGVPLAAKGKSRALPSETGIGKSDPFAGLHTLIAGTFFSRLHRLSSPFCTSH